MKHYMLDHLQKFTVSEVGKKHSSKTKEMLNKLCTQQPGTEQLSGIVTGVDDRKED